MHNICYLKCVILTFSYMDKVQPVIHFMKYISAHINVPSSFLLMVHALLPCSKNTRGSTSHSYSFSLIILIFSWATAFNCEVLRNESWLIKR